MSDPVTAMVSPSRSGQVALVRAQVRAALRVSGVVRVPMVAAVMVVVARVTKNPAPVDLILITVAVASAAGGMFADPAGVLLACSPTGVRARRLVRLGVHVVAVVVTWSLAAALALPAGRGWDPASADVVVLATFVAVVVAVAAWIPSDGHLLAAPVLLVLAGLPFIWPRLGFYPVDANEWRWLVFGVAALAGAWRLSPDPPG